MPTLLILFGLRFFFYSEDHEPMHVHVQRDNNTAKFDFSGDKVFLVYNHGLSNQDIKNARKIIVEHKEEFSNKWKAYFEK